jgi:hypothetical protein
MSEAAATEPLWDDDLARPIDVYPAWLDEKIETAALPDQRPDDVMKSCWVCRGTGAIVVDPPHCHPEWWRCLGCRGRGWVIGPPT